MSDDALQQQMRLGKEAIEECVRLRAENERLTPPEQSGLLSHTRSCSAGHDLDASCTCALQERIWLQTEQTMSAAWRKRAEEAEAEVERLTRERDKALGKKVSLAVKALKDAQSLHIRSALPAKREEQ